MSFLSRKKKEMIPEAAPVSYGARPGPPSQAPSYRSQNSYSSGSQQYSPPAHNQYGGGRGDAPPAQGRYAATEGGRGGYGAPPPQSSGASSYGVGSSSHGPGRAGGGGGGGGDARAQLLSGAPRRPPATSGYGSSEFGGGGGEGGQEMEEEEEVEGIKQQMRFVKQESLASTRNAMRIAREAEETAMATLNRLGDQSDQLANAERHIDMANSNNSRAQDQVKELNALNRSIFRPSFTFNKTAKRDAEEARILKRHEEEQAERERTRQIQYDSRERISQTQKGVSRQAENTSAARARAAPRGAERARYQFEATESDDEVEGEIDDNLDELSGTVGRLRMLAMAAGTEVDNSNRNIQALSDKVDHTDRGLIATTVKLGRVK